MEKLIFHGKGSLRKEAQHAEPKMDLAGVSSFADRRNQRFYSLHVLVACG